MDHLSSGSVSTTLSYCAHGPLVQWQCVYNTIMLCTWATCPVAVCLITLGNHCAHAHGCQKYNSPHLMYIMCQTCTAPVIYIVNWMNYSNFRWKLAAENSIVCVHSGIHFDLGLVSWVYNWWVVVWVVIQTTYSGEGNLKGQRSSVPWRKPYLLWGPRLSYHWSLCTRQPYSASWLGMEFWAS